MAFAVTIATPTAEEIAPGTYTISVEATLTDEVTVKTRVFATTLSTGTSGARNQAAIALANQIVDWRNSENRVANFAATLAGLKTNIEGRL